MLKKNSSIWFFWFFLIATVFLKWRYLLFRNLRTCSQNFARCKNMHVFKIYVQDSILAQIIKTCWNANLEIFFAEKILNVAVISIISDILKLFFLIYFILKGLFFLYYFTWCWFVIFMITFFLLINYFANLNSLAVFWNVEFEIKLEHSCLICHALFLSKNESFMFRSFHFFPVELVNEYCSKFSSVYNFLVSTIIVFYAASLYACLKVNWIKPSYSEFF